jgi:hypothetical protein
LIQDVAAKSGNKTSKSGWICCIKLRSFEQEPLQREI